MGRSRYFLLSSVIAATFLGGCAASSKTFYANPTKVGDTKLCRTIMEASSKGEQQFANDTANEAGRRGLTWEQCQQKVMAEDAAIISIAVIATGVTVAAACQNGCSDSGYSPAYYGRGGPDVDCLGGGGDGPQFVRGPFRLNGPDVYGLDADHDGIACEPYGDYGS